MAMEAEQVWKLFEQTGNIEVYMLYKQLEKDKKTGDRNYDQTVEKCCSVS